MSRNNKRVPEYLQCFNKLSKGITTTSHRATPTDISFTPICNEITTPNVKTNRRVITSQQAIDIQDPDNSKPRFFVPVCHYCKRT